MLVIRVKRNRTVIEILGYIPLLLWLPEDGNSVLQYVEVNLCHKWHITECMCWMIY